MGAQFIDAGTAGQRPGCQLLGLDRTGLDIEPQSRCLAGQIRLTGEQRHFGGTPGNAPIPRTARQVYIGAGGHGGLPPGCGHLGEHHLVKDLRCQLLSRISRLRRVISGRILLSLGHPCEQAGRDEQDGQQSGRLNKAKNRLHGTLWKDVRVPVGHRPEKLATARHGL